MKQAQARNEREQVEQKYARKQAQLREQALIDREAAEEANKLAEREEIKLAEVTKEAEAARRERAAAEQRLAGIRDQIAAQLSSTGTITIGERDEGCVDKDITKKAIEEPLKWQPNLRGRTGFWLPFGNGFFCFGKNKSISWSVGDKARVQDRDGNLLCLEPLDDRRTSACYWTAIGRPPSKRAIGPMPSEDSKLPYEKSLTDVAENEIEDELEAMGFQFSSGNPQHNAKKFRTSAELIKKQAAPYVQESARYLSGKCEPARDLKLYSYLTSNDSKMYCEYQKARFQRNYGLALRGDYEAQQKVSECFLRNECAGVVTTNEAMSCVWEMVSIASGDRRVTKNAKEDYEYDCVKKRTTADLAVIQGQAVILFEQIYHRALPSRF